MIRDKLSRHLVKIHKFEINEAHMKQSEVRVYIYNVSPDQIGET